MAARRVLMTVDAVGGVWSYAMALIRSTAALDIRYTVVALGPVPSPEQAATLGELGADLHHRPYRLEWMPDAGDDVERSGAWLQEMAAAVQPDVVHLNGFSHAALPFPCATLVVEHSCVLSWWRAVRKEAAPAEWNRYRASTRAGLLDADALVAPTRAIADAIHLEHRIARAVEVIPNGLPERDAGRLSAEVPKEPIVFTAGRVWDAAKNIAALQAVAARIAWPVVIAGETAEPGREPIDVTGVHALGGLSRDDVRRWMQRAAVYVAPARYEPFGLSVLEAAREGCALVLGDIPSLREVWDGAAIFVDPDDSSALATTLDHLARAPEARETFAARARQRARRYTAERMAAAYAKCYAGLSQTSRQYATAGA